ncbi:MAG TPA: hypothetical protein VFR81_10060 [Longimicrobium sp.]|nr:hypothetical protein [Longimicrobium sp.]
MLHFPTTIVQALTLLVLPLQLQSLGLQLSARTPPGCPEKRIVVLLDISGSMDTARIDTLHSSELLSAATLFGPCGGELAFGLIGESPPARLQLLSLPARPPLRDTVKIRDNAYEGAQDRNTNANIRQQNASTVDRWRHETEERRRQFGRNVDHLLRTTSKTNKSPVCEATRRADRFLREAPSQSAKLFAILITDGADTTQRDPCPVLSSRAEVILVKDGDDAHNLRSVVTRHVSSFASALRIISNTSGR